MKQIYRWVNTSISIWILWYATKWKSCFQMIFLRKQNEFRSFVYVRKNKKEFKISSSPENRFSNFWIKQIVFTWKVCKFLAWDVQIFPIFQRTLRNGNCLTLNDQIAISIRYFSFEKFTGKNVALLSRFHLVF